MTLRGILPSMVKEAQSSGSTLMAARPLMRNVRPMPGIRNVAQRIDTVVAATVGDHHGPVVDHAHETGRIATRRAVQPFGTGCRQDNERRDFDEAAIMLGDVRDLLDHRRTDRLAVERFEFRFGRDDILHSDLLR